MNFLNKRVLGNPPRNPKETLLLKIKQTKTKMKGKTEIKTTNRLIKS